MKYVIKIDPEKNYEVMYSYKNNNFTLKTHEKSNI